jgi:hypothetical protein
MSRIYFRSLVVFCLAALALFGACKKTENFNPVATGGPLAVTLSDSAFTLNEANKNNTALTVSWTTGSNHGTGASISYVLELDKKGNNFSSPLKSEIGKGVYSINYTHVALNTLLQSFWSVPYGSALTLEARICTIIGDGKTKGDTSSAVAFTVTSYKPVSATLYIVGDATSGGWDLQAADSLTPDNQVPGLFHFTGRLAPGQFKFITTKGAMLPSYNKGADSAHLVYRTAASDPDELFDITAGNQYDIDVNLLSLTISVAIVQAPLYSQLWIVGDATPNGWDIDHPNEMKVDPFNPYVFHYNEVLKAGEFKFPTATGNWGGDFYRPLVNHPPITDTLAALTYGSANPPDNKWAITAAGAYKISLNIQRNSIHVVSFTPYDSLWLVGDATSTGWNIDHPTPLTKGGDGYTFTYSGPLTVGEFKIPVKTGDFGCDYFRPVMNHPPLTDGNAPFVAHAGGAADADDYKWYIPAAGNYTITFNQLYETISIVKQ